MPNLILQYLGAILVIVGAVLVFSDKSRIKGLLIEIAGAIIFKIGQL